MKLTIPHDARYEIKFVAYEHRLPALLTWIKSHWAVFRSPYPERWVNSIYFDTYNYHSFLENLSGASARIKVRYRWYGRDVKIDKGTLEVKCKRNYFGWKLNYKVATSPYADGNQWRDTLASIRSQISGEGWYWIEKHPMPIFINQYYRKYFVSHDERVRITVDTHQNVWDQRFKPSPNFLHKTNLPKTVVVELKFHRNDQEYAAEVIQGMPLRVSRHSKYITGVRSMRGMGMRG